jgi:hypothetical protein
VRDNQNVSRKGAKAHFATLEYLASLRETCFSVDSDRSWAESAVSDSAFVLSFLLQPFEIAIALSCPR